MKLSYFLFCLLALISCKKTEKQLTKITAKNIAIDSIILPSSIIDSMVAPYKEKLSADMQQVLCYSSKKIDKNDGDMQSSLGNLMADMCFEMANPIFKQKTNESVDFVLLNYGGIRASIPAGEITKEHAFKLMPFENELVIANLTGEKVSALIDYFIQNKKAHPLSKNIELRLLEKGYNLKINGEVFNKNNTYNVLTSDYLQGGGDKMDFFKEPKKLIKLEYKIRDAIIDYLKKIDTLQPVIDNRVMIK